MVRKSEAQRKGKTRLAAAIEAAANNPEELLEEQQELERMNRAAEDWTSQSQREHQWLHDEFVEYFRVIYRSICPDGVVEGEDDPWQNIDFSTRGVDELLRRFKAFLGFKLRHTSESQGPARVTAATFKSWAVGLIIVSLRRLQLIDRERGRLFSEWTKLGQDGLYSKMQAWVQSTVREEKLARLPLKPRFYGRTEAALCFKAIMAHADSSSNFPADLQKILYIQWLLNAGQQSGSALKSSGKYNFLRMRNISIKRHLQFIDGQADHRRWGWNVEVEVQSWKGDNDLTVPRDVQNIVFQATEVDNNLQFELATSLVPLMIFRGALAAVDSRGEIIPIRSVAEFLQTDQMLFMGVGDEPLFVAMAQDEGGLQLKPSSGPVPPLTTESANIFLGEAFSQVGLAAAGAYAFRYMEGDMASLDHREQFAAQTLRASKGLMHSVGVGARLIAQIETTLQAPAGPTGRDIDEGQQSERNEPGPSRRASEGPGPSRNRSEVNMTGNDPDETTEPGPIDTDVELTDERSDMDEVQARRACIMLFYEGRLLAESRLTQVEDHWIDGGYCPFCPLELAGLCEPGSDSPVPVGGPFLKREGDTWLRAPRSKETRKQVRQHLRNKHGLIWAAIVAGGELPPFNTDVTSDDRWPTPEPEELAEIHALLDAPLHYTEEELEEISAAFDWPLTCTDEEFAAAEAMLGGPMQRPTSPFDARARVQRWIPYAP